MKDRFFYVFSFDGGKGLSVSDIECFKFTDKKMTVRDVVYKQAADLQISGAKGICIKEFPDSLFTLYWTGKSNHLAYFATSESTAKKVRTKAIQDMMSININK